MSAEEAAGSAEGPPPDAAEPAPAPAEPGATQGADATDVAEPATADGTAETDTSKGDERAAEAIEGAADAPAEADKATADTPAGEGLGTNGDGSGEAAVGADEDGAAAEPGADAVATTTAEDAAVAEIKACLAALSAARGTLSDFAINESPPAEGGAAGEGGDGVEKAQVQNGAAAAAAEGDTAAPTEGEDVPIDGIEKAAAAAEGGVTVSAEAREPSPDGAAVEVSQEGATAADAPGDTDAPGADADTEAVTAPTPPAGTREDAEAAVNAALAEVVRVALVHAVFEETEGDAALKAALEGVAADPASLDGAAEAIDAAAQKLEALVAEAEDPAALAVAAAAERVSDAEATVAACAADVEAAGEDEEAVASAKAALVEAEAALADAQATAAALSEAMAPPKSLAELEADLEDASERADVMHTALELAIGEVAQHAEAGGAEDDDKGKELASALAEAQAAAAAADTTLEKLEAEVEAAREAAPPADIVSGGILEGGLDGGMVVEEFVEEIEEDEDDEAEMEEARRLMELEALRKKVTLVRRLQEERSRKEQLIQDNTLIQSVIAELMRRRKNTDRKAEEAAPKSVKNVSEQEARYAQLLTNIKDTEDQMATEQQHAIERVEELTAEKAEALAKVETAQKELLKFKRKVASTVVNSRTGKKLPESQISEMLENEATKVATLREERLRYIKYRNQLQRLEAELAAKEQLADGLHFIDFEQLKLTNQAHNEKIEERNVELARLKAKIQSTVQVLSHLKEKLAFTKAETESEKVRLQDIEKSLARERDLVTRQKRVRDKIRTENTELEQKCGLIGQNVLLRDYEEQHEAMERTTAEIEELRQKHSAVKSRTLGYKKKLEQLQKQQPELFIED